jgi:hypothetical protein
VSLGHDASIYTENLIHVYELIVEGGKSAGSSGVCSFEVSWSSQATEFREYWAGKLGQAAKPAESYQKQVVFHSQDYAAPLKSFKDDYYFAF